MTVADCDRDLWRSGRRQCPSHDIDCEYRVDLRSACSPPFAVPGIGESAGGEAAQCFDPLITRGVTRVERGRYPIWGCSGLQQLTRLPSRSRTAENRGILSIGARTIELKKHHHKHTAATNPAAVHAPPLQPRFVTARQTGS